MTSRKDQYRLILLRHGETEWSRDARHTSFTDLELLDVGREQARLSADVIKDQRLHDPLVISSPRRRAMDTAPLAGLRVDVVSGGLVEWDYGDYEGLTTPEIRQTVPDWTVWTHGCPGGETTREASDRADRAIAMALEQMAHHDVVFVGHGHFSRLLLTRWIGLPASEGIRFWTPAASVAVCGFEKGVRQIRALGLTGYTEGRRAQPDESTIISLGS